MLGYPQLIDFLQHTRPDLPIPDGSWPLQQRAATAAERAARQGDAQPLPGGAGG